MEPIRISIFDIFKIGPGPSSSHTVGPMKAAKRFLLELQQLDASVLEKVTHIEAHLYGSLSSTGKGHGTDRAIVGGLLGWDPDTCDIDALLKIFSTPEDSYKIQLGPKTINFVEKQLFFDEIYHSFPYSNTMIFRLMSNETVLLEKEYYSVGGGFIQCKGEDEPIRGNPIYRYSCFTDLQNIVSKEKIPLMEILLQNEEAITKVSREEIFTRLRKIKTAMRQAVERGLKTEGVLPGYIRLKRKAMETYKKAKQVKEESNRFLLLLDAYALAGAEENGAGHRVVTAPTNGSAGIIPALVCLLEDHFKMPEEKVLEGLIAAACIGFVAKQNASISGAEVGCQGEVGVSASMGAALLAQAFGHSIDIMDHAAEIALEHNLGLTCDPIGGYVQIPCIERNAVGSLDAYNAYLMASAEREGQHKISFDEVLKVMMETGKDMSSKYKETSKGGLAKCKLRCINC